MSTVNFYVKTPRGNVVTVVALSTDRVGKIKEFVFKAEKIPILHQKLTLASKPLEDDKTLQEYNIRNESMLHLMVYVPQNLNIFVQTITGEILTVQTTDATPTFEVKRIIQEDYGVPAPLQRLVLEYTELADADVPWRNSRGGQAMVKMVQMGYFKRGRAVDRSNVPAEVARQDQEAVGRFRVRLAAKAAAIAAGTIKLPALSRASFNYVSSDATGPEIDILHSINCVAESMRRGGAGGAAGAGAGAGAGGAAFPPPPPDAGAGGSAGDNSYQSSFICQPGLRQWTGDTTATPLVDLRDLPDVRAGDIAADEHTRQLLAQRPDVGLTFQNLGKNPHFCAQVLSEFARQQGCFVSLYDSSVPGAGAGAGAGAGGAGAAPEVRDMRHDNMQHVASMAPSAGVIDARRIMQLVVHRPDGEWVGCPAHEILDDREAAVDYVNGIIFRIARACEVRPQDVDLLMVSEGGVKFTFTFTGEALAANKHVTLDTEARLRAEFESYMTIKVHPMHSVLNFDLASLDLVTPGACKDFGNERSTYPVGPAGRTRSYYQPTGWYRIGLKVLRKYGEDTWLHPFQHAGNWYRAYHGTRRNGVAGALREGFNPLANGRLGPGVYVSPHVDYADSQSGEVTVTFSDGSTKRYRCVFMCAVRPDAIAREGFPSDPKHPGENSEWAVLSAADVRPYGILIKQIP